MTQPMICNSCKQRYDSIYHEKQKSYKPCHDCRKKRGSRKKQASFTPTNENNLSTKSSTQQSQSSI